MTKTNKQSRAQTHTAREKVAVRRAAQARAERRRRILLVGGAVVAVLAVIGALVAVGITTGGSSKQASSAGRSAAPASVVKEATSVPPKVLNQIGTGKVTASNLPQPISGAASGSGGALTANGKPVIEYVGAEYCPYCAGERWAMVVALSRFGKFSDLKQTTSSAQDVFPNTHTFSFYKSSYTSPYVVFRPKEIYTNQVNSAGNGYQPLEKLSGAEQKRFQDIGGGAFPYINVAGKYKVPVGYDAGVLQGKSMSQIAAALDNPSSDIAQAVDGAANAFTAAICKATSGNPADVCTSPAVKAFAGKLK